MQKKIFLFIILLFLPSCGYEAINKKKNIIVYDFSISEISFEGDRNVNLKIKEKLNNYTISNNNKKFAIKVSSTSEKIALAKNTVGNTTSFKNTVSINVEVLMNNKFKNNFVISESFNYKNTSNKFDLKRYEKEIKSNLAETLSEKLIFRLSNIQ